MPARQQQNIHAPIMKCHASSQVDLLLVGLQKVHLLGENTGNVAFVGGCHETSVDITLNKTRCCFEHQQHECGTVTILNPNADSVLRMCGQQNYVTHFCLLTIQQSHNGGRVLCFSTPEVALRATNVTCSGRLEPRAHAPNHRQTSGHVYTNATCDERLPPRHDFYSRLARSPRLRTTR